MTRVQDRRWVVRANQGTAISLLTASPDIVDPLVGYAGATTPLPPFSDEQWEWWTDQPIGTVSSDGTIVLCLLRPLTSSTYSYFGCLFNVSFSLLHPGEAAWTTVQKHLTISPYKMNRCSVAYHDGTIVLSEGSAGSWCIPTTQSGILATSDQRLWWTPTPCEKGCGWVKKDDRSLAGRILFLGLPSSFAVDTALFDMMSDDGCAYFIIRRMPFFFPKPCMLFKYSFCDGKSELIEHLPIGWHNQASLWLTSQPVIVPTDRRTF
ncbi:hypothetical protein PR202_ga24645 [Eleusine coracana subsp. coracana]|uniref:Uncharacterized protein n=1 Tax=Eleusine coracana subsp. coracana TaxID=191504 RepID=A0AAV5D8W8_ELECO|nr:hypothetical protein PR202_ga24645 [Eleusine coracana subsp. coracana]